MHGKTVVVTGGNSGIGLETAAASASMGATVLITARMPTRAGRRWHPSPSARGATARSSSWCSIWPTWRRSDAARPRSSNRHHASTCSSTTPAWCSVNGRRPWTGTRRPLPSTTWGPFLLTNSVARPSAAESAPARVVNGGVDRAQRGPKGIPFDDLQIDEQRYAGCGSTGSPSWPTSSSPSSWPGASKAVRSPPTRCTPERCGRGTGPTATRWGFLAFGIKIASPFFLSPAKGARTSVYLASSPEVEGVSGKYFVKCPARQATAVGARRGSGPDAVAGERQLTGLASQGPPD